MTFSVVDPFGILSVNDSPVLGWHGGKPDFPSVEAQRHTDNEYVDPKKAIKGLQGRRLYFKGSIQTSK